MGLEGRLKSTPRTPTVEEAMHYSLGVNAIQGVMSGLGESALGEGKLGGVGRVQEQWDLGSIHLLTVSLSFPSTEDIDKDLVI